MNKVETLVVGAGPAGSTAAEELASAGAHVLLLDREKFPRDKPCGGGVTSRAANLMPEGFPATVEQTISEARLSKKGKLYYTQRSADPMAYMTQRSKLDEFLAEQAVSAGTEFHDGEKVTGISEDNGKYRVQTSKDTYTCDVVIGADGANGIVARSMGINSNDSSWVAIEGNMHDESLVDNWSSAVGIDLGLIPGGYGWVFPKGDHVNIGVGGSKSVGKGLRGFLEQVSNYYGVKSENLVNLKGHLLPTRRAGLPVVKDRVLLVGDAASLVDPISGEGIYPALLSGKLAAEAVIKEDFSGYQEAVERNLGDDLEFARRVQTLVYWQPWIDLVILKRSPRVWRKVVEFLQGETTYTEARDKHTLIGGIVYLLTKG